MAEISRSPSFSMKTYVDVDELMQCDDLSDNKELDEDVTPEETGKAVPAPPTISPSPPAHQLDEIPLSQSQLLDRTEADFKKELRSSPSHLSRDSCDGVLNGPSKDDGHLALSQEDDEAAADCRQVTDEVNSVLSVDIQASLDGGSCSVTAAASCLLSKDRAAKKTSQETPDGGCKGKKKKSQLKRIFSGWQKIKIHPASLTDVDEAISTGDSRQDSCCSQETLSTTSSSAAVGADLKSIQLELVDYIEEETSKDVTSVSSLSSVVTWSKSLKDPPIPKAKTDDFQEDVSSSLSHFSIHFGDEDGETVSQSSVGQSLSDSECLSNNQADVEDTKPKKSNRFLCFFSNIFSKNHKKNEKKTKKTTAENLECPPFWSWLLCTSPCKCCFVD